MLPKNTAVRFDDGTRTPLREAGGMIALENASGFVIETAGNTHDDGTFVPDGHAYVGFKFVDPQAETGVVHRELVEEDYLEISGC